MFKKFIIKIILCILLLLLLTSLALLIIGKFCDNYDEYSDVSNGCYKINSNLHEDVFKIFIIIGSISTGIIIISIIILFILLCCCC